MWDLSLNLYSLPLPALLFKGFTKHQHWILGEISKWDFVQKKKVKNCV